jgi:hypothetical protein
MFGLSCSRHAIRYQPGQNTFNIFPAYSVYFKPDNIARNQSWLADPAAFAVPATDSVKPYYLVDYMVFYDTVTISMIFFPLVLSPFLALCLMILFAGKPTE